MASLKRLFFFACIFSLSSPVGPVGAQTDLSKFPLSRAIPADVFLAVMGRHNPDREFLTRYWGRVKEAFMESGILGDCWEIMSDSLEENQLDQIEKFRKQFGDVCEAVDWQGIFSKESVFAQRYVTPVGGSPYEGVLLGRMDSDKAEANYRAIKALLEQVAKFVESRGGKGAIAVTEVEKDGWTMAVLGPAQMKGLGIAVAHYQDVIAFGFGGLAMLDDSIALLQGKSKSKLLIDTPRFKKALATLPPAEDEILFWDTAEMFQKVKGMMSLAMGDGEGKSTKKLTKKPAKAQKKSEDPADDADDAKPAKAGKKKAHADDDDDDADADDDDDDDDGNGQAALAIVSKVLDEVSMFDFVVCVEWTEGHRVFRDSVTSLSADAKSKRLFAALTRSKPVDDFQRFIPKEADSFSCSAGVDWVEIYRAIRGFVKEEVPRGEKQLSRLDRLQSQQWHINIEKDVLAVLSGGTVSVSMGNDWVFMLGVRDEEKANALTDRLVKAIQSHTGKEGGLMLTPVEIDGKKFTSISHPMMMMVGLTSSPVWGCAEGHLMIGSSAKAVKRCLSTAKGEHANITKSKRWLAQGLRPDSGSIHSISFEDESKTGEQLQAFITGLSMASGMLGMVTGGDLPPEVSSFITKLPPILAKVGPIVGKINFYDSSADFETFKDGRWHKHSVQNYKAPKDVMEDESAKSDDDSDKPSPKKADRPKQPRAKAHDANKDDDE